MFCVLLQFYACNSQLFYACRQRITIGIQHVRILDTMHDVRIKIKLIESKPSVVECLCIIQIHPCPDKGTSCLAINKCKQLLSFLGIHIVRVYVCVLLFFFFC